MTPLALSLVKPERSSKCGLRLQSVENGAVTVLATTPGGLAAAAGLLPGDELKQVAGIMVLSGDQVGRLLGQAVGAIPILVSRSTVWPEEEPPAATPAPPMVASGLAPAVAQQAPSPPLMASAPPTSAATGASGEEPPPMSESIYHEKQLSALCGVHALNNLLQGPYYGAGDLADVARAIDARELALLSEDPPAPAAAAAPRWPPKHVVRRLPSSSPPTH